MEMKRQEEEDKNLDVWVLAQHAHEPSDDTAAEAREAWERQTRSDSHTLRMLSFFFIFPFRFSMDSIGVAGEENGFLAETNKTLSLPTLLPPMSPFFFSDVSGDRVFLQRVRDGFGRLHGLMEAE